MNSKGELGLTQEVDIYSHQTAPFVGANHSDAGLEEEPLLVLDNISMSFGGVKALQNVDFDVRQGEILGLIGPNGAGKTTCFNVLSGIYQPSIGSVRFRGKPLGKLKKYRITKMGIARTFQNVRLFPSMTVLENVLVGTDSNHRSGIASVLLHLRRHQREESRGYQVAMELLKFMGLEVRANELAGSLPYGDQRRLEIARAMATNPRLLCLDEPAAGFNPAEKVEFMGLIRRIRDRGLTILLIEHDMQLVMGVTDRIVVLEFGQKIAEGIPSEIRSDARVIAAYLGTSEELEQDA